MSRINVHELLATMTPEQIELLLRGYVKQQFARNDKLTYATFSAYGVKCGVWQIGVKKGGNSYETTKIEGEVLATCVGYGEQRAREDAANKLLLIESDPGNKVLEPIEDYPQPHAEKVLEDDERSRPDSLDWSV